MASELRPGTWWKVLTVTDPKVKAVQVLAVTFTHFPENPALRVREPWPGGGCSEFTAPMRGNGVQYFPDEGAAYGYAVERAEKRRQALQANLDANAEALVELRERAATIGKGGQNGDR